MRRQFKPEARERAQRPSDYAESGVRNAGVWEPEKMNSPVQAENRLILPRLSAVPACTGWLMPHSSGRCPWSEVSLLSRFLISGQQDGSVCAKSSCRVDLRTWFNTQNLQQSHGRSRAFPVLISSGDSPTPTSMPRDSM